MSIDTTERNLTQTGPEDFAVISRRVHPALLQSVMNIGGFVDPGVAPVRNRELPFVGTPIIFSFGAPYRLSDASDHVVAGYFGLEAGSVYPPEGPTVDHAVMYYGIGGIMLGSDRKTGYPLGTADQSQDTGIYMIEEDFDAHYARAIAAGAEIAIDLYDTDYGSREYTTRDFEGHLWSFGNYRPERFKATEVRG
jgi:uncharacterized glyoxalase superfamily protein PhnB